MLAPDYIQSIWKSFDDFPMETLTKAWLHHIGYKHMQREITLMQEHRQQYGLSGNCFDLAIWLLDSFKKNGVEAYPIGHQLGTKDAHVAVIAKDEHGYRYLCDLGDQWITPVLLDSANERFTFDRRKGFFPAASIQVKPSENHVNILYHRPNGKTSSQLYHTEPIEMSDFYRAAEASQKRLKSYPLVEYRVKTKTETKHWECSKWQCFLSTNEGIIHEPVKNNREAWVEMLHEKIGYDRKVIALALEKYGKRM